MADQQFDPADQTLPLLPEWVTSSLWFKALVVYLIIQAVLGIVAFEWAWHELRKFRNQSNDNFKDERIREFLRTDPHKWARWKMYPVAMFTLLTRFIILVLNLILITIFWRIMIIGYDFKQGPIRRGFRQKMIENYAIMCSHIYHLTIGMYTYKTYKDVDYSYYLGPDYKKKMSDKTTSTVIANHVSWLDPIVMGRYFMPQMTPKAGVENAPLVSTMAKAICCLYIPRGGTQQERDNILSIIGDRQTLIENSKGTLPPLLIFPEGTTTNGKLCLQFKKGPFYAEKKIRPFTLTYSDGQVNLAMDSIAVLPLFVITLSWFGYTCHFQQLPDFEPNEYLFKTHAKQGKERWEIYAWALREIIMEHGNLKSSTLPFRVKAKLIQYMNNAKGAIHPNDIDSKTE